MSFDPSMKGAATTVLSGDRKGMLVAALCFVHCVAGPILLSIAGFSSLIGVSEKVDPVFLLSSAILGSATLFPAYRKKHRRLSCLGLFLGGVSCLAVRHYVAWTSAAEIVFVGVGASLIIAAHALNMRFCHVCRCCEVDANPGSKHEDVCDLPRKTSQKS